VEISFLIRCQKLVDAGEARWEAVAEDVDPRRKRRCSACGSRGPHRVDADTITCRDCGRIGYLR
jgi:hypothetical protein